MGSREILEQEDADDEALVDAHLERINRIQQINRVGPAHPRRLIRTVAWIPTDDEEDDEE